MCDSEVYQRFAVGLAGRDYDKVLSSFANNNCFTKQNGHLEVYIPLGTDIGELEKLTGTKLSQIITS